MNANELVPDDGFLESVRQYLEVLYPDSDRSVLSRSVVEVFDGYHAPVAPEQLWTEADSILITYGDSIVAPDERPLTTLRRFLKQFVGYSFSVIHVLPFSPYSSDDGFAVIDYEQVNPRLGEWRDLTRIGNDWRLMGDLVINHVSSESAWFQNFRQGRDPGREYFREASPDADLSEVVRPRTSSLLQPVETPDGIRYVWCTFSHDQIDVDFQNPDVLIEYLKIIRLYLEHGISIFRLDAVGFLWKEVGTPCIHLPQTHEVIRLIRLLLDQFAPGTLLITETNVPNHENLTYFGNRNEAHIVYNFSLAPLLVHSLLTGNTMYLKRWMMSMPPSPVGCTYLNFTASHDGIGMRPAEGLISESDQQEMIDTVCRFGGQVSRRKLADGSEKAYELNISLFDAMKGTIHGEDQWQIQRFLCSQTVMMAVEGIPAMYIHSLLATSNDLAGVTRTGRNRSINRAQLDFPELQQMLADESNDRTIVFQELIRRLRIRSEQPAFHPNATQFTLQPGEPYFAFWRQSQDRSQSIFAIHNMTDQAQDLRLTDLNLISLSDWMDLLSGEVYPDQTATIEVQPYQCFWITNRNTAID